MTESNQSTVSDKSIIFIHELMQVTTKDDKELTEFINHHLFPQKSQLEIEDINNNVKILKELDGTQQALVKGRAKNFEEVNDPSKYFPSLIAIYGLVLSLYTLLRETTNSSWLMVGASILMISFLAIYTAKMFTKITTRRSTAVFFTALLDSINFKEK